MEKLFTQMGAGNKQITERFAEFAPPMHEQHVYYAYEPHEHTASSKHHYGGGHKSNAAMSALTLLAFLFFLHILQQCVREHMNSMNSPHVMIMTAGREDEITLKTGDHHKLDKAGETEDTSLVNNRPERKNGNRKKTENQIVPTEDVSPTESQLMKISTAVHVPKNSITQHKNELNKFSSKPAFPGFVNAMTDYY